MTLYIIIPINYLSIYPLAGLDTCLQTPTLILHHLLKKFIKTQTVASRLDLLKYNCILIHCCPGFSITQYLEIYIYKMHSKIQKKLQAVTGRG